MANCFWPETVNGQDNKWGVDTSTNGAEKTGYPHGKT